MTHRDPSLWHEPDRFDPERFAPEQAHSRPRYSYFPFLAGPHQCIGKDFALVEVQLTLTLVAQRYRFEVLNGSEVVPEPLITLRPRGGLVMRVHKRRIPCAAAGETL